MTDNTERDELAGIAYGAMFPTSREEPATWPPSLLAVADAILAAGYRKPRQVTTVRELHALPDFSVVRSEYGAVFEKGGGWWAETGTRDKSLAVDIALPATVLHVGGAE